MTTQNNNTWHPQALRQSLFGGVGAHFTWLTMLVLLGALLLISGLNLQREQTRVHEELLSKGELLGHFVATISPEAIYSYDLKSLNDFSKEISLHNEIVYSVVVDPHQQALTSFLDEKNVYIQNIKKSHPQAPPAFIVEQLQQRQDIIHLISDITHHTEHLGEVWIGISTQHSAQRLKQAALEQLGLNFLLIACISIGVLVIFRVKVLNPIHHLIHATHCVSAGQFEHFIDIKTRDEFGSLAESFNFMMQAVQQNNESFTHMIEMLQVSIMEKDQALFDASEQNWLNEGIRLFVDATHSCFEIKPLAQSAVDNLSQRLELQVANAYLFEGSDLHNIASSQTVIKSDIYIEVHEYALLETIQEQKQAVLYQDQHLFSQVKHLQQQRMPWVYYLPLLLHNKAVGLFELAFTERPKQIYLGFLQYVANHLAISIYASQQQQQTQQALQITQEKTRQLEQKSLELRLAMEDTERATKAKSVFLANMSHELRTPLNAILGFSEMLAEDLEEDGADEEMLSDMRKIHRAGQNLLSLVNDVLDISKIESGRMDLYIEMIDVEKLLTDITNTITPLVEKNHCTLTVEKAETLDAFYADQPKIRQILLNLLSNAIKFGADAEITLSISKLDTNFMEFRIKDRGIGISPEQIDKLFKAFTQADASTTRKYGGTGLGLTICKEFSEMMGGKIWVESQLGEGSCFIVQIPTHVQKKEDDKHHEKIHLAQKNLKHLNLNPIKEHGVILVVDDDHEMREVLSKHLKKLGYHPLSAASGQEALSMAHKLRPDAITLDVMMPEMDGWTVLKQLKAEEELRHIPVIMVSMLEEKQKGYALGATEYMVKPIEREQLAHVLRKYQEDADPLVMLVEDDETTRDMMSNMLERIECNVITAENGKIALQRLQQHQPDVILLDLMMPEMSGLEFAQVMHQHPKWHSIPIIVLTAKELTPEDRQQLDGCVEIIYQKGSYQRVDLLQQIESRLALALQH